MNKWIPFSPQEVSALTAKPKPIEDNTERQCPCCGKNMVRRYFHEFKMARTIGTSWFWCHNCKRYTHFTGGPLSQKYLYDDPLGQCCSSELQDNNWYDYLDSLWEEKILPQTFKRKDGN